MVTLIEGHEFDALRVNELPEAVRAAGMDWHHLPIRDGGVPDARFDWRWRYAGLQLRQSLRSGGSVFVHCRGGLGRAGMVASRLLVEFGSRPQEAIAAVRAVRPGAVETSAQEDWVARSLPRRERVDEL